jgi:tRNA(fMet)-specific endonuclease VapC
MYLIDTNIIIYSLKGVPEVVEHFRRAATQPKAISVITYGELMYGAMKSTRTQENLARVRRVAELFPVIDVSRGVMETFSALKAELEGRGTRLDDLDLVIAATALVHGSRLVTRNTKHFRRVPGLEIEDWTDAP